MEELKSCIFCGKGVDRDFAYCPWCGYEFGPGDDERSADGQHVAEARPLERGAEVAGAARGMPEAPVMTEPPAPPPQPSVFLRLQSLEELLSGIERELDRMLKSASRGP